MTTRSPARASWRRCCCFNFWKAGRLTRLPLLLVTPRVWLELTPQVLGILRGLGG